MSETAEELRRALTAAHTEALRVGDSPVRADRLFAQLQAIAARIPESDLGEERSARLASALETALRVLRRDEDGREAARHLQSALRLVDGGSRPPSPFLDD
jgi:hypothetical protein